ncbi:hypothetical protein K438DRAFT_424985 [Mycena galopus ATCC 62051]|nr:hypothetical protein K438DRAFT_424985 [Mycena galopus ATCC 62051]
MIVDDECGMPLDLGRWESLWLGENAPDMSGGDIKLRWAQLDAELNPDLDYLPVLDPEDERCSQNSRLPLLHLATARRPRTRPRPSLHTSYGSGKQNTSSAGRAYSVPAHTDRACACLFSLR